MERYILKARDHPKFSSDLFLDSRNDPSKALVLGNGAPIDPEIMKGVVQILENHRTNIPWVENDVMLVDNTLAMHARMPFTPPRRILASLMK